MVQEINWDEVYKTEKWRMLKYAISGFQFQHLQMSENGNAIEANPATHKIAQFVWQNIIAEHNDLTRENENLRLLIKEGRIMLKRLNGLILLAHSEGYNDAFHHIEYTKSWNEFQKEYSLEVL